MSVSISGEGSVTGIDQGLNVVGVVTATTISVGSGTSVSSPATNVLTLGTNNTEAVRLTSTGRMGVGKVTPLHKLEVAANPSIEPAGNIANFTNDTNADFTITCGSSGITTVGPVFGILALRSNNVERVRVSAAGSFGFNTTTPQSPIDIGAGSGGAPTYKGTIRIQSNDAQSTNSNGGIEFLASSFSNGYGFRVGNLDLGGGSTPFIIESRSDSVTWTERVRIDSSGRVTTPYQISFAQFAMSGTAFNSGTMSSGTSDHNVGGYYNTSTGIFTAPIAGYYQFGCGILVQSGTGRLEGQIIKNNSLQLVAFNGTGTTFDGPTAICIAYLAVNDNVRVTRVSGTAYSSHGNNYFWGRLLG